MKLSAFSAQNPSIIVHRIHSMRLIAAVLVLAMSVLSIAVNRAAGQQIPTLRIPELPTPPDIDGQINAAEWEHAARITGFQQFGRRALIPSSVQPVWYLGYDAHNLYVAQYAPVYPKGSIKARVKLGDNGGQNDNADGILGDDHVEIQISVLPTREQAIKQYFYKIMTNPYGAVVDQRTEWSVGWMGMEWESKAQVRASTTEDGWSMEMAIPLSSLGFANGIADGTTWFMQLVSASDASFFYNAWQPVLWTDWDHMPAVTFDSKSPIFQLMGLGDVADGKLNVLANVQVQKGQAPVEVSVTVTDADKSEIYRQTKQVPADGQATTVTFEQSQMALSDKGQILHLLARQGDKVLYEVALPFDKATREATARYFDTMEATRSGSGQPVITSTYYHSYQKLRAMCDVAILGISKDLRNAKVFKTSLRQGDTILVQSQTPIAENGQAHIQVDTPKLAPGDYTVVSEIIGDDGKVLASRTDPFIERHYDWEGNKLGTQKIVVDPYTPVQTDGLSLKVWGRTYQFADSGLPTSLVAKGQDLLGAPIRLEAQIGGKDIQLKPQGAAHWSHADGHNATLEGQGALGESVDVAVQADTEYDGTTFYTIKLSPKDDATVDRLDLVIPLQKLTDWQMMRSSGRDMPYGEVPQADGVFWDSSRLSGTAFIHGTFLPYCVVSDGERGLSWAADSDQDWLLDDDKPSFFLEKKDGLVLMRARLVNTPSALKRVRTIRFMLTAMPTKPKPAEYRYRMWGTVNAPFGWMNGFQGSGMWAYGAGPTITLQNQEQYDILANRLEQDRRRVRVGAENVVGPKFLPMSAWYVATNTMGYAMPEYDTYSGEWVGVTAPRIAPQEEYVNFTNEWGTWSTPRQQSRAYADLAPSTVDLRVWAYDQMQKKAGMNGYWWDHSRFWTSGDLIKHAAYVRDDGKVQGIFNIELVREMMKRMATVAQVNGQIPFQGYYSHGEIGPVGSFMQWLWAIEGPWYTNSSKVSLVDNIRGGLDGIRILLHTYEGIPVTMRNETQDRGKADTWQTRSCLGVGLLFDVGVGVEGGAVDDRTRNKLVEDLRRFDYFNDAVQWVPYWRTGDLIQTDSADVVTTVYTRQFKGQTPGAMLVLFNKGDKPVTISFSADGKKLVGTDDVTVHDLEDFKRDPMATEDGRWNQISIGRHNFRLFVLGPRASNGN